MQSLNDTQFIIYVTRHYHWLVEPVAYFYKKYLDVPLLFFSDRPIPGHDAKVIFPLDFPLYETSCGHMVKEALRQVQKPLVTIGMMDLLPCAPVNMDWLATLEWHMARDENVARGNLWSGAQWTIQNAKGKIIFGDDLFEIKVLDPLDPDVGQIAATSLMPALWRRDFLLDFIEDDWFLDSIELPGQTKFAEQNHWYSVGTFPGLVDYCHMCYTSDKKIVRTSTIPDAEDRAFVEALVPQEFNIE